MALYHVYRPQDFSSIIGQEPIVKTLENQVANDKTAHAYLFAGPRGVGKTTTARILAKALNCEKRKDDIFDPCNTCESCKEISTSRAIDVIEIDAASHTGVDSVRENIIENAQFKPTKSVYKVFIIDEVHMLSTSAFNALLKTLEEPPDHTVFILATTELHKLPDTIISRCQQFDFKKIPYEIMKKQLQGILKKENVKMDSDVLDRVIVKSDGCDRDALNLLDQLMSSGEKKITRETASLILPVSRTKDTLAFISALITKNMSEGFSLLAIQANAGIQFFQFAKDTLQLLRSILISSIDSSHSSLGIDLSEDAKKTIETLRKNISQQELICLMDILLRRKQEIKTAPLPQLPLEMALVEWCTNGLSENMNTDQREKQKDKNEVEEEKVTSKTKEYVKDKEPEKPSLKERVKHIVSHNQMVTKEEVENKWNEIIKRIESESPSLSFILKLADIHEISGNQITLAVHHSFHKDKLMEKACKRKVVDIFSDVLGKKTSLDIIITETKENPREDKELQDLASAFGGEIVQ